jgi:hypothetical protein
VTAKKILEAAQFGATKSYFVSFNAGYTSCPQKLKTICKIKNYAETILRVKLLLYI